MVLWIVSDQQHCSLANQIGGAYALLVKVSGSHHRCRTQSKDERRRYYRATALGAAVLAAETERMAALLGAARAKRVRPR